MRSSGRSCRRRHPITRSSPSATSITTAFPTSSSRVSYCWMARRRPGPRQLGSDAAPGRRISTATAILDVVLHGSSTTGSGLFRGRPGRVQRRSARRGTAGYGGRLRTADFNRDGRPDLVFSSAATASPSRSYLGQGERDVHQGGPALAGAGTGVELGDLDRDGIVDVVASSASDGVTAFLGDGRVAYATKVYGAGTSRYGFALGDVTEDGMPRFVVADGQVEFDGARPRSHGLPSPEALGTGPSRRCSNTTPDPGGAYP